MAQPAILVEQQGPLPISVTFPEGDTGPATLIVSGSVWTQQPNQLIGIDIQLDGTSVGQAVIWSNGPTTHRAVVPVLVPVSLDKPWEGNPPRPPDYEVTLAPLNADTLSDHNDYFQVSLLG